MTQTLPRWDMTVIYPGLESPEFAQGFAQTIQDTQELARLFDAQQIGESTAEKNGAATVQTLETVIGRYNAVIEEFQTLYTYINCFVDTNSHNTLAQARLSELQGVLPLLSQLGTRFTAWAGSLEIETLIAQSSIASEHAHALRQAQKQAAHLMSPAEEALAAELNVGGGTAWSKLHSTITSQLSVALEVEGQVQEYPMPAIRNMAQSPDRDLRRRAYEAELACWERSAVPLAAALNGIKSEVNVLVERRKWGSALDESLFISSIDRQTLEAMLGAARASFPDFRRYLQAKARMLKVPQLAWYDIEAPVVQHGQTWEYPEATKFIVEQFGSYSERLSGFAERAFRENWIDAGPQPGKVGGAYCTELCNGVSRILANFTPTYSGVSTLAHELGHGYHNFNLVDRTPLQRTLPMTLAETASIFCETIIRHAAQSRVDAQGQIAILEEALQSACGIVVDISSRFLFEQGVFERRKQRELSIEELNDLMLDAQRQTYGAGLDQTLLHPYMWAVKGHYYSSDFSYYNYPYMFGMLFGLGLYAQYQQEPERFKRDYDRLLSSTGMADATTLAAGFGIDLHSEKFWQSSLDIIRRDIDQFVALSH